MYRVRLLPFIFITFQSFCVSRTRATAPLLGSCSDVLTRASHAASSFRPVNQLAGSIFLLCRAFRTRMFLSLPTSLFPSSPRFFSLVCLCRCCCYRQSSPVGHNIRLASLLKMKSKMRKAMDVGRQRTLKQKTACNGCDSPAHKKTRGLGNALTTESRQQSCGSQVDLYFRFRLKGRTSGAASRREVSA